MAIIHFETRFFRMWWKKTTLRFISILMEGNFLGGLFFHFNTVRSFFGVTTTAQRIEKEEPKSFLFILLFFCLTIPPKQGKIDVKNIVAIWSKKRDVNKGQFAVNFLLQLPIFSNICFPLLNLSKRYKLFYLFSFELPFELWVTRKASKNKRFKWNIRETATKLRCELMFRKFELMSWWLLTLVNIKGAFIFQWKWLFTLST